MRFGHFNKRVVIISLAIISFLSCNDFEEEEVVKPIKVHINIPVIYDYVIKRIRSYELSDIIPVSSSSGLNDQLKAFYPKIQYRYYLFKDSNGQYFDLTEQNFYQTLNPDLYKFYTITYDLFKNSDFYDLVDTLDYHLSVSFNSNELFNMRLIDSNIVTNHLVTDLGQTTLNSIRYRHLYKLVLKYDQMNNNTVKTVYFDIEKGIIRFETFSNEVFLL